MVLMHGAAFLKGSCPKALLLPGSQPVEPRLGRRFEKNHNIEQRDERISPAVE